MHVQHVDTCLSCYVLDWCNGEDELLIGVYVDGSTRIYQVKEELHSEIEAADYGVENFDYDAAHAAINEAFRGVHPFAVFDSSLGKTSDDFADSVQAFFRFSW